MSDWISELKAEQEKTIAEREVETTRALFVNKTLATDGPKFWASLVSELGLVVGRFNEAEIDQMRATISDTSTNIERALQIVLSTNKNLSPRQIHTNVFYSDGSERIRCHPLDVAAYNLSFAVRNGELAVVPSDSHQTLTANGAATRILQPMVRRLRN
jgi:hypothetical protein